MAVIEFPTKFAPAEPWIDKAVRAIGDLPRDLAGDLRDLWGPAPASSNAMDKIGQASARVAVFGFALGSLGALAVSAFVG
ncbi:MAG: hypothetical protein ABWZ40_10795 [Caulobacterales bacterium]